jgi:hypothetical protein
MDQQQFEARLDQIESSVDERIAKALQNTAGQVQQAIDAMSAKWQKDVENAVSIVGERIRTENARAVRSELFTGLFEQNAAAFLDAIDAPNPSTPQLQRELYAASDAAVAGLNHGPTVRFHHLSNIELATTVAGSALAGIGLRALAVRTALYLKQRRERKEQEAGLSQI